MNTQLGTGSADYFTTRYLCGQFFGNSWGRHGFDSRVLRLRDLRFEEANDLGVARVLQLFDASDSHGHTELLPVVLGSSDAFLRGRSHVVVATVGASGRVRTEEQGLNDLRSTINLLDIARLLKPVQKRGRTEDVVGQLGSNLRKRR